MVDTDTPPPLVAQSWSLTQLLLGGPALLLAAPGLGMVAASLSPSPGGVHGSRPLSLVHGEEEITGETVTGVSLPLPEDRPTVAPARHSGCPDTGNAIVGGGGGGGCGGDAPPSSVVMDNWPDATSLSVSILTAAIAAARVCAVSTANGGGGGSKQRGKKRLHCVIPVGSRVKRAHVHPKNPRVAVHVVGIVQKHSVE